MNIVKLYSLAEKILRDSGVRFNHLSAIRMNRSTPAETYHGFLIFIDEKKEPVLFLKLTPHREKGDRLAAEFKTLLRLNKHGNTPFKKTIPKPLSFLKSNDLTVLAETAAPGIRMKRFPQGVYFSSGLFRTHFLKVVSWLVAFHQTAALEKTSPIPHIETQLVQPIQLYRNGYNRSRALDTLLEETRHILKERTVRFFPRHGDFCTANILVSETGGISVIDWESFLPWGWPLSDLLYFISSIWCIPYEKGLNALKKNYVRIFFTPNQHAALIKEAVGWYLGISGIKPDLMLALSTMVWVFYANEKRAAMEKEGHFIRDDRAETYLPLVMVENNHCINLEMLASNRNEYLLNSI